MATGFFGGRDLKSHFFQARPATFVGLAQAQTNSLNLPAGAQVGDLALFYGVENTSATSSGIQGIAAGPTGWTVLTGAQGSVAQVSTTPAFITRGIWWKKLVAADIAVASGGTGTGVVSFTVGSLGIAGACGVCVFRGGTQYNGVSDLTFDGRTSLSATGMVKQTGAKVYILLMCMNATLAETITQPPGFTSTYPGAMFAGAFFFQDPSTFTQRTLTVSWTSASGGSFQQIDIT